MKLRHSLPLLFAALTTLAASVGFAAAGSRDARPKLVMVIAEPEYDTAITLPEFATAHLAKDFRVVTVAGSGENAIEPVGEIADADVLLISVRRRMLPAAQLEAIRKHVKAGKPVVGIRTASHAFALGKNQKLPEGSAEWATWDAEVIGGNYGNHHGKGPSVAITLADKAPRDHPILRGVKLPFTSESSLYKNTPLKPGATALITGTIPNQPAEPLAWTFKRADGGRTFYTSLGGPTDFKNPSFTTLLRNGLLWAAGSK
jgi:type 1 glutamine amidotransferase